MFDDEPPPLEPPLDDDAGFAGAPIRAAERPAAPVPTSSRVPPHSIEAEESLLGAMLLSDQAISAVVAIVDAEDFYKPAHRHIYDAITTLYSGGQAVDPVTVADALRTAGLLDAVGGPSTLLSLQARTPAITNAAYYAEIVQGKALLRRLIGTANEVAELGYQPLDDLDKTLDTAESMIYAVAERRVTDTLAELRNLLDDSLERLEQLYERGEAITGTPSGYWELDELLSGLQPNALLIVGARPAMGKTAFALGLALNAAVREGLPSLYFSLEMSHLEITQRLLAQEARVDAKRLKNGDLTGPDWTKISKAIGRLGEGQLWIDDNPNLTINEMRAKARRLKSKVGKIGVIVVDYLQLMSGRANAESRQIEIAEISRGLKKLARELECPVVALSQLSRSLESRADKRPMLADLRESGSLEQDADVVMFLYRDEVYHPDTPDKDLAEVIVAKHRSGPTGIARLVFLDYCTLFANPARSNENE